MRIEYEANAEDYADYRLALSAPAPMNDHARQRAGYLPPWVSLLAGIPVVVIILLSVRASLRWDLTVEYAMTSLLNEVGQAEWLLPWICLAAIAVTVGPARRRGRSTYRLTTLALAVFVLLAFGLLIAANFLATKPALLQGNPIRWFPWVAVGSQSSTLVTAAWFRPAHTHRFDDHAGPRSVTFDDEFVFDEGGCVGTRYRWPTLKRWAITTRLVLIYDEANRIAVWFPKRAVGTREHIASLAAILKSRVGTSATVGFDVE